MATRAELQILAKSDIELLRVLKRASSAVDKQLKSFRSDRQIRLTRALVIQREIHAEILEVWRRLDSITQTRRAEAALAAVEDSLRAELGKLPKNLQPYLVKNSRDALDALESRLGVSNITLSERISRSYAVQRGTIDRLIEAAIATERSEADLAADLEKYMRPDAPGGASFAAMRIARTEIGNAYHAAAIQRAIDSDGILALQWVLSGSHKVPDLCNQYAGQRFAPEDCPLKPHPLCLCTIKPVVRR